MEDQKVKDYLTSKEVCAKYGINKYTLQNWRRGYYIRAGKRYRYFEDESGLPHKLNVEVHPQRIEYDPIKVAVWVNKLTESRKAIKEDGR